MSEPEFKKCDIIKAALVTLLLARCVTLGRPFPPASLCRSGKMKGCIGLDKMIYKFPSYYKFYDFNYLNFKIIWTITRLFPYVNIGKILLKNVFLIKLLSARSAINSS